LVYRKRVDRARLDPVPELTFEPGRAIVGSAAVLVTRVVAVRGRWAFLDASRNHLPESPLLFARRVLPVILSASAPRRFQHLSGATLNTTDILDLARCLPPLQPGDLLALCDAGVYSLARASRYAGLTPAAYLVDKRGTVQCIRRAEGLADLTATVASQEGWHV
jgi:diaminopimelate decarboxylase